VHLHIRRFPAHEIPQEKEALIKWCYQLYQEKDELLEHFKKHNHFPNHKTPSWDPPQYDSAWGIGFWFPATIILTYAMWASRLFLFFQLFTWIAYILIGTVSKLREWMGINPPPNYLSQIKQAKKHT